MTALATVADLELFWRPLSASEKLQANQLLKDATAVIEASYPVQEWLAIGRVSSDLLAWAVKTMVKDAMLASEDEGRKSVTQQAGPFSRTETFDSSRGRLQMPLAVRAALDGVKAQDGPGQGASLWAI